MKKTAVVTPILIGLLVLGVFCVQTIKAEDHGNITINADGSITPSTAAMQQTGNTYTLTSNANVDITVEANNIVLDGKGYILLGEVTLTQVSNVTIKNFIITETAEQLKGSTIGIALNNASKVRVANNTVIGITSVLGWNWIYAGIYVMGGNSNTIIQNNLMYNLDGMEFINTSYNLIVQNNITDTPNYGGLFSTGIYFAGASNNTIYHNNFANSTYQAKVSDSTNVWDDGYLGNYWSDYKAKYPYAGEIDGSEIGSAPYVIDEQNIDQYPLLQPFDSALYAPRIMPKIAVLSPVNQVINESSVPLVFTVNKQISWMGYSLDSQDNVTVTGNSTLSGLTNGLHKITVYANDTFGNMCASETQTFVVAVPAPAPFVLASAGIGIAVLVVGVGLFYYVKKRLGASKGK